MAYDNSSTYGDEISDYYYDIENNLMNPPSPVGYFIYKIVGGCFDWLDELVNQFRIDLSILDCNVGGPQLVKELPTEANINTLYYVPVYAAGGNTFTKYEYVDDSWESETVETKILNTLDSFWGRSYNLERPHVGYVEDGVIYSRMVTDDEYKIYLYLRNHRLMTRQDLLVAFTNAFGVSEDSDDVAISASGLEDIHMVNHKYYDNPSFSNVTLAAYDPEDKEIVIDDMHSSMDVNVVIDKKTEGTIITVFIPNQQWDTYFLSFLEEYISIKGNVIISQTGGS